MSIEKIILIVVLFLTGGFLTYKAMNPSDYQQPFHHANKTSKTLVCALFFSVILGDLYEKQF